MKEKHAVLTGRLRMDFEYTIPVRMVPDMSRAGTVADLAEIQFMNMAHLINNKGCPGLTVSEIAAGNYEETVEDREES